jgi:hypothetical protein
VQTVNEDGFATDLSWQLSVIESGRSAELSRAWIPEESGTYTVKIFIWDSMSESPTALSEVAVKNIKVN